MWNPVKDYPLSSFVDAIGTIVSSLILFCVASILAFLLTSFDPSYGISLWEVLLAWVFVDATSAIGIFGIPFLCVLFWVLYRLIYSDDPKLKLLYIAVVTQSAISICVGVAIDSSGVYIRGVISAGVLIAVFFVLRKYGILKREPEDELGV